MLDFRLFFPYNTSIGCDGIKYPLHARPKRAFGWWKKAAAASANTSLSPGVKKISSVPTVRRLQRVHEDMFFVYMLNGSGTATFIAFLPIWGKGDFHFVRRLMT